MRWLGRVPTRGNSTKCPVRLGVFVGVGLVPTRDLEHRFSLCFVLLENVYAKTRFPSFEGL
jgi:hypothetical protein